MESFLKILTCMMLAILITVQLLLASPYRQRLTDDTINGRIIKTNETLVYKGTILLEALGKYGPNSSMILINGEPYITVDTFPVDLPVNDGDIVEIRSKQGSMTYYVFISAKKGQITAELKESTVLIKPGMNLLFKVSPLKG